jgi:hypothetical protein
MNQQLRIMGWVPSTPLEGRQALNQEVMEIERQWPELTRVEIKRLVFAHWLMREGVLSDK